MIIDIGPDLLKLIENVTRVPFILKYGVVLGKKAFQVQNVYKFSFIHQRRSPASSTTIVSANPEHRKRKKPT